MAAVTHSRSHSHGPTIRILIADDHRLFAEALQAILAGDRRMLVFVLVTLVLMHSGRDAGMGGMGFTPASQGGTHIVERNLTRLTTLVAVLFFVNSIALFHYLK